MGRVDRRRGLGLAAGVLAAVACTAPEAVIADMGHVQEPGASASATCAAKVIKTATGPTRMRFALHGRVSCATAHRTLVNYFARVPDQCLGSGCFIRLPSGWSCATASGEVTHQTGEMTVCERGRATIETYAGIPR
jgi:hypothetical protein